MELLFGYLAGLLTLINPCVLSILPIVLASSLQAGRHGPLAVAAGLSISFVGLGLVVTALGHAVGLEPERVADAGAVIMILFGLVLLIPRAAAGFETATAGFAARADSSLDDVDQRGYGGQLVTGLLLGAVWSPCIGPTLGGAISLASQGESLLRAGAIMLAFALGVSSIIVALGYGARSVIQRRQAWMRMLASRSKPILGAVFVLVGTGLLLRVHHWIEIWAIDALPPWMLELSVSL